MPQENTATWEIDGRSLPLFPFDEPAKVTLPNGTTHYFKQWNRHVEDKREGLLKTIVIISPAVVNGENPRDVRTDFTRASIAYYELMIDRVQGYGLSKEEDGNREYKADEVVSLNGSGDHKVLELIRVTDKKAAASRLYGGRVEVEKPNQEEEDVDFDPFNLEELDISDEIEKWKSSRQVQLFTIDRKITVRQELGGELLPSGVRIPPSHIIRYTFREPTGKDFSDWEMKSHNGFAITLPKGGQKAERFYNLDTVNKLFNRLIVDIQGASINGVELILEDDGSEKRNAQLAQIPLLVKKHAVVSLFNEIDSLGN